MNFLDYSLPRRTLILWLILSTLLAFTSCKPDEDIIGLGEDETEMFLTETSMEAAFEEISILGIDAVEMTDTSPLGRLGSGIPGSILTTQGCPVITHDAINKEVLIDFGAACTGPNGKVRSGKIMVRYTQRLYHPGSSLQVELDNYHVDNKHIEGQKTITNTMDSFRDTISFETVLVGGKISWPDGTSAERAFTREGTWVRGVNFLLDEFHLEGMVDGSRRNGTIYEGSITSSLIFKRSCRLQGVYMASEGIFLLKRSGMPDLEINYGDGSCDYWVTLSQNGQSRTVDVRNL